MAKTAKPNRPSRSQVNDRHRERLRQVKKKVLIVVENAAVPFDTRVWKEALSLRGADTRSPYLRLKRKGPSGDTS